MPRRTRSVAEPDLFSLEPGQPTPARPEALPVVTTCALPRPISVADIERVISGWNDEDIEQLRSLATHEVRRRGLEPVEPAHPPSYADTKTPVEQASRSRKVADSVQEIAPGQVSAIRAAGEAGVKLSKIAREFGVPLAKVKQIVSASGSS